MIHTVLCCLMLATTPTLKVWVHGDGYLRFAREGRIIYASSATLSVADGQLVAPGGAAIVPSICIPDGASDLTVAWGGAVSCRIGKDVYPVGQLVLALFDKADILRPDEGYLISKGRPRLGNPGEGDNGVIRSDAPATASQPPAVNPQVAKPTKPLVAKPTDGVKTAKVDPAWHGSAEVTVAAATEVPGDHFLLGEIAEIHAEPTLKKELEAVPLGDTPALGVPRVILAGHIIVRLRMAGIKPESVNITVPAGAVVSRLSQKIPQAKFLDVAKAAAKEKLGIDVPLVCKDHANDFAAPLGQLELSAESAVKTTNGVSILVAVKVDGKRINSRVLNLSVDAEAQGVRAGDAVKILIHSGGATFEIAGKTRTAGWVGQTVTVVTDTGSTHTGKVVSSSVVEVKL